MSDVVIEEYRSLRQELEVNRRFIFERPLLVVGGTLAATLGLSEKSVGGLLAVPFLIVLAFNLWFTFNRMQSNARIIAYLQLVHEGTDRRQWVGWENALRMYRIWQFRAQTLDPKSWYAPDKGQSDRIEFYKGIFRFHLALGFGVTALLILQPLRNLLAKPQWGWDAFCVVASVASLLWFLWFSSSYRNDRTTTVERNRQIWSQVLAPTTAATPTVRVPLE